MKNNKYLFIVIFFVSFFSFIFSINADYKATVLNPSGAKCSLYTGSMTSTGYCYYANSNLNSYVSGVIWLDTGDEVTVLTNYDSVPSPNKNLCSDYYVYTSYYFASKSTTYKGYYCNANLNSSESISDELKQEFSNAGFPESYFSKLAIMKQAHPNWNFKAINTNLSFNDVVTNETYGANSLLRRSMANNYAYLSLNTNSFDYYNDRFIAYDDISGSDPWYLANYDAIAYYIDPRNFLSDMYIFQFETLSYDSSISDDRVKNSINTIFSGDYLNRFTDEFLEAGKVSGVNPIYLASLSKEEVSNGSSAGTAINGSYNGMYNFYNIGANSGDSPVYNGLRFAANTDEYTLRPWNTEYKAIVGGAKWIFKNYVEPGQDTSYFKKYNVVYNYLKSIGRTPIYSNYAHQYMQNIKAPSSEATTTYRSYYKNDMLGLSYTFYIPVYNNMPNSTSLPTKEGWPNNYLSSLTINGNNVAGFDGGVETYNYNLDINSPTLKLEARSVSSSAKIEGLGTFNITGNTTRNIKVTAQNGDIKTYKINVTLTGNILDTPIDVVTTLNNAGIKNGNKYITGISVGTDISVIKNKIINANSSAVVSLMSSNGNTKNSGVVSTGDKVKITVGSETKTYEIVIYGDVNGDGKIMANDYLKIKNTIMGTTTLSGPYAEAAQVNKKGKLLAADYLKIKNYIMGIDKINQ